MIFEQCSVKKTRILRFAAILMMTMLLLASCVKTGPSVQTDTSEPAETTGVAVDTSDSSGKEQKPVTVIGVETGSCIEADWVDEAERAATGLKYSYIHLSEADRQNYPKLEQAITELSKERKEASLELYDAALQSAREVSVENPDNLPYYSVKEEVTVRRADSRVFSLLFSGYVYSGGPHGQPYTLGAVFDSETGERLKLADVVTDVNLLPELAWEQLEAYWDTDYFYDNLDLNKFFSDNLDSIEWVLDYNGLSIFFQHYDIAPYASGAQNVTLSFASHPELVKDKYRDVPDSYGIEIVPEKQFFCDMDGDGKLDSLTVSPAKGAEYDFAKQKIVLNGESFEEDTGIFEIDLTLLHTADGNNYLYIGQEADSYGAFEVFDLSRGKIDRKDIVYSEKHRVSFEDPNYNARQVLTDPQSLILDSYTQVLGTALVYDTYHVGTNGLPEREGSWYTVCNRRELTLLKNLSASVVGEDGKVTGKTELKAGDKVIYYRTDGETRADLKLSDGSIVRVNPLCKDGEWTLDGMMLEEVFDGIIFGM